MNGISFQSITLFGDSMISRDDILQQAMNLSPEDRAFVVDHLEMSLIPKSSPEFIEEDFDPKIHIAGEEFVEELKRRITAYERGETTARLAEDVLADLYADLKADSDS